MSSVIVEPAAISVWSPTVTGAIRFVLHPINASLPTIVLNLFTPSTVIEPQPIFVRSPISASQYSLDVILSRHL